MERFHTLAPFALEQGEKEALLLAKLLELIEQHRVHSPEYRNFLRGIGYDQAKLKGLADLPFLPVRLFKTMELKSVADADIFKVVRSSGTTGLPSVIYLDKTTALLQQKVLTRILADHLGKARLPLLVVDTPDLLKDRSAISARAAAVIGLSFIAKKTVYALNTDMSLNEEAVMDFLHAYGDKPFLIFGFTFMLWQHLYQSGKKFDMQNAFLMSGGGWKKLVDKSVSKAAFKDAFQENFKITRFLEHYGMAEQTGAIYTECECGHLHASIYSDIIVRRTGDFSVADTGEVGAIEVISSLPHSYPGNLILTEDLGRIVGVDDCPCGRKGKYIEVLGRIKQAELRGCSDTYASQFS